MFILWGFNARGQMPGCPPYTKGFVCSKRGFVAFFVGTHIVIIMVSKWLRNDNSVTSESINLTQHNEETIYYNLIIWKHFAFNNFVNF